MTIKHALKWAQDKYTKTDPRRRGNNIIVGFNGLTLSPNGHIGGNDGHVLDLSDRIAWLTELVREEETPIQRLQEKLLAMGAEPAYKEKETGCVKSLAFSGASYRTLNDHGGLGEIFAGQPADALRAVADYIDEMEKADD